jgi:ACS family tartrate transporter-like MFS transporter
VSDGHLQSADDQARAWAVRVEPPPQFVPAIPREEPSADQVMHKVSLRILPFLFVLYFLNILDRVNIGFARLKMLDDLHLSEEVYGLGAGLFFIGYFLFEVPSNLILRRLGARRWIARILISWGIISASMMFVRTPWSFYFLRFLLGVAEAGFFPGIILYLTAWFPARQRARAVSRFMTASAITGLVGNPVSGFIMQYTDQAAGLAGWQWLFLLEGIPAGLMGIVVLFYLTDFPAQAQWLTAGERTWLAQHMQQEEQHRHERHGFTLPQSMADPRIWVLCLLYFTIAMGSNSFGAYMPQILKNRFMHASESQIGLLGAAPSLVAVVAMVLVGSHSDRTGERRWHVALAALTAAAGWTLAAQTESPWTALLGLALAQGGMLSTLAPFWSLPTSFLSGAAAAAGIAFINSLGNLGGFVGPIVIARLKERWGSYAYGMEFLAATLVIGCVLAVCARHDPSLERPDRQAPDEAVR